MRRPSLLNKLFDYFEARRLLTAEASPNCISFVCLGFVEKESFRYICVSGDLIDSYANTS